MGVYTDDVYNWAERTVKSEDNTQQAVHHVSVLILDILLHTYRYEI